MIRSASLAALLFAYAPFASAGTLDVGPAGSGAAFTSIHAAVLAAQAGDTILVQPGTYAGEGTLVLDKSLSIVGAGSGVTVLSAVFSTTEGMTSLGGVPLVPTTLAVNGLLPAEQVSITGLSFDVVPPTFLHGKFQAIRIDDCAGAVVLSDVVLESGAPLSGAKAAVSVTNSDQVLLSHCDFAPPLAQATFFYPGNNPRVAPGLYVESSSVTVNNCSIYGGGGHLGSFWPQIIGEIDSGPAVWADNATVRIARSTLNGGKAGAFTDATGDNISLAGPAVGALDSNIYIRGPVGEVVGGQGQFLSAQVTSLGAPAVVTYGASVLTITSDVPMSPGTDGVGGITAPLLSTTGSYFPIAEPLASMEITPSVVALGGGLSLDLDGPSNAPYFAYFSFGLGDAFQVQGLLGSIVLDLNSYTALPPQVLDAAGHRTLGIIIPAIPGLVGTSIYTQGIAASSSGTLSISSPAMLSIH